MSAEEDDERQRPRREIDIRAEDEYEYERQPATITINKKYYNNNICLAITNLLCHVQTKKKKYEPCREGEGGE